MTQVNNKQQDAYQAAQPDPHKLEEANNSSMAQNMKEMKQLGKDMEKMKTAPELEEQGLKPDPTQ